MRSNKIEALFDFVFLSVTCILSLLGLGFLLSEIKLLWLFNVFMLVYLLMFMFYTEPWRKD